MEEQIPDFQIVNKVIQTIILQSDILSGCGLDVCVAVTGSKRIQFWVSNTWNTALKSVIRKAANSQAGLDEENMNVDMFLNTESDGHLLTSENQRDRAAGAQDAPPPESYVIEEHLKLEPVAGPSHAGETGGSNCILQGVDSCFEFLNSNIELGTETRSELQNQKSRKRTECGENTEDLNPGTASIHNDLTQIFQVAEPATSADKRPRKSAQISDAEKKYKCTQCNYSTDRTQHIKRHNLWHSGKKPFKCTQCDYSTCWSGHLAGHIRTHTGEKPYRCSLCDYKSAHSAGLLSHMRSHTGNFFYCEQCDYKTSNKGDYNIHKRLHLGQLYRCEFCDYTALRHNSLRSHMRRHTGEKPYKCTLCNYRASHSFSVQSHIRIHHQPSQEIAQVSRILPKSSHLEVRNS